MAFLLHTKRHKIFPGMTIKNIQRTQIFSVIATIRCDEAIILCHTDSLRALCLRGDEIILIICLPRSRHAGNIYGVYKSIAALRQFFIISTYRRVCGIGIHLYTGISINLPGPFCKQGIAATIIPCDTIDSVSIIIIPVPACKIISFSGRNRQRKRQFCLHIGFLKFSIHNPTIKKIHQMIRSFLITSSIKVRIRIKETCTLRRPCHHIRLICPSKFRLI